MLVDHEGDGTKKKDPAVRMVDENSKYQTLTTLKTGPRKMCAA